MQALADAQLCLLGKGSNGSVCLVRYEGQLCALKTGLKACYTAAFEKEAAIMAKLGGAGGAPLPLGFCPETPALLMTFCGSRSLEDRKDLGDQVLLQIGVRLAQALQEVHLHDIVHCDLKPDNVTLQFAEDGRLHSLHVIDYGFACAVGGSLPRRRTQNPKPWYCHCFYNGTPMRKECDVQGLGYVLELLEEAMTLESPALDELIARAFDPEHEKRPTLQEAEALLSGLLASLSETEADVEAEETREAQEERREARSLPLRLPASCGPPSAPAFLSLQTEGGKQGN